MSFRVASRDLEREELQGVSEGPWTLERRTKRISSGVKRPNASLSSPSAAEVWGSSAMRTVTLKRRAIFIFLACSWTIFCEA